MYSRFSDAVGDALVSSFPTIDCRRGPVPADGGAGSIYYDVVSMNVSDGEAEICVRYVYFPGRKPCAVDDGMFIAGGVSELEFGGERLRAEKLGVKAHGKYIEVTVDYGACGEDVISGARKMETLTVTVNAA